MFIELTSESGAYKVSVNTNHIQVISNTSSGYMVQMISGDCEYVSEESYHKLVKVVSAETTLSFS